jgi:hypothetical protein
MGWSFWDGEDTLLWFMDGVGRLEIRHSDCLLILSFEDKRSVTIREVSNVEASNNRASNYYCSN